MCRCDSTNRLSPLSCVAKRSKNSGGLFGALASGEGITPLFAKKQSNTQKLGSIRENATQRNTESTKANIEDTQSKADSESSSIDSVALPACKLYVLRNIKYLIKYIVTKENLCQLPKHSSARPLSSVGDSTRARYRPKPTRPRQNTEKKPTFSQNKVYDLGKIEITDAKSVDHNASITTITNQDIDNTSSKSVDEALRFSPGVFIQPPSGARRARNPNPRV